MPAQCLKILVIDDEEADFDMVNNLLARSGMNVKVEWASSYLEGVGCFKESRHDAYLLDYMLGDHTGIDFLEEAQRYDSCAPIILMTGIEDRSTDIAAMKAGATDYLVKGEMEPHLLERAIRYAINRKKNELELAEARNIARRSAQAKAEFLANMSHEIRTPMNGVMGMLDLLQDTALTEQQQEYVTLAHSAAETMMLILNDILDLSSMESDRLILDSSPFMLCSFIEKTIIPFKLKAAQKGLSFSLEIDSSIPEKVAGDEVRLGQIVRNLLSNALKFTEKGTVGFFVRAVADDEDNLKVYGAVNDTGIGIPEDRLESIFNVFTQADSSSTKRYSGTGLGLSIVKRLCNAMGGDVSVKSTLGQGSSFQFEVELKTVRLPASNIYEPAVAVADSAVQGRARLRILLVEDSHVNQLVLREVLEKQGHIVTIADNGMKGVAAYQHGEFDLILMDLQMPEMDGYEATRIIRTKEKIVGGHIPIVALTANVFAEDRKKCFTAGMDSYLSKPVSQKELRRVISSYFPQVGGQKVLSAQVPTANEGKQLKVFDVEGVMENIEDMDLLQEIALIYLEKAPIEIDKLVHAMTEANDEAVERSAHTLKGMSLNVGAARIADKALQLQMAARQGGLPSCAGITDDIKNDMDEYCAAVKAFISQNVDAGSKKTG